MPIWRRILTQIAGCALTPEYASPEQFRREPINAYRLGADIHRSNLLHPSSRYHSPMGAVIAASRYNFRIKNNLDEPISYLFEFYIHRGTSGSEWDPVGSHATCAHRGDD